MLSEDTTNDPKLMRFSEEFEDVDVALLKESVSRVENFPVGSIAISLGNIAQGKFLYIKPKSDISITLDAGSPIVIRGGKATKMWAAFTALSLTIPGTAGIDVSLLVAGE